MKQGRGLLDMTIYDELKNIPGCAIVVSSVCNFRINPKTKKRYAEIHEDDWPTVKDMVRKWKEFKRREH